MSKKFLRNSELTASSQVLKDLLQNNQSPLAQQFTRWKLWRKWPLVVGEDIAKNTDPVGFYRGTMYIWVPNSTWLQQMIFLAAPLREKINGHLGGSLVKQVRFTLDRSNVPKADESAHALKTFIDQHQE